MIKPIIVDSKPPSAMMKMRHNRYIALARHLERTRPEAPSFFQILQPTGAAVDDEDGPPKGVKLQ